MTKKIIVAILIFSPLLYPLQWDIEFIEGDAEKWHHSLALNAEGNPWILFVSDSTLYVKHKNGTQWKSEIVDVSSPAGIALSIGSDEMWVAASDWSRLYAYHKTTDGWIKTFVQDLVSDVFPRELDLAVGSNGYPHICYIVSEQTKPPPNKFLKYATITDSLWRKEYVDTFGLWDQSYSPSIIVDENNYPHVGYAGAYSSLPFDAIYAYRDTEGWHLEGYDVGIVPQTGSKISITLDLKKMPHLTYREFGYPITHIWKTDTGWFRENIEYQTTESVLCDNVPCQTDPAGTLHIVYSLIKREDSTAFEYTLLYGTRDDTGWVKEVVVDTVFANYIWSWCDMKLDSEGNPHIVYSTDSAVYYAVGKPNSGETETKAVVQTPFQLTVSSNPSQSTVHFSFFLPQPGRVALKIYDTSGRCVRTLLTARNIESGTHTVTWDGRDDIGKAVPPGIYFCRLATENRSVIKKLVLLK